MNMHYCLGLLPDAAMKKAIGMTKQYTNIWMHSGKMVWIWHLGIVLDKIL